MNKHPILCTLPLWLIALLSFLCVLFVGLTIWYPCKSAPNPDLEFKVGSEVHLIIGGRGQVVDISGDQYKIRIWGLQGLESYWFYEWELEAPIVDPFNPMLPPTQDILEWRYKA